ncbi:GGDEF domain-containing protein [Cellvibrio sp. pealriver]|uniref:GGDEF domain-containing protein n=1 Tax=Cellvibrio sp. pealriver TaxID=1622269 RepID=UPI00066FBFF7|nr:GGDEF domain-containing protein [Cellvibrio sp. pealriver]
MALFDLVNTIGFTLYFGFAVLLLWLSRIPRTNAGTGYWGIAIFFGFCARLTLYLSGTLFEITATEHLYAFFISMEKVFLLAGVFRFFNLLHYTRPYLLFVALALLWIASSWLAGFNRVLFSLGVGFFNAVSLLLFAFIAYRERDTIPHKVMLWISIICILFMLHWLTYPVLRFHDSWMVPGFLIGTSLAMLLYLSLISAVLLQFQKRLLDAERHALDLAYHDPLTGLNNKRYMTTLFDQALILATRPHQMLAVIYIDLDNFKPINDTAGHMVGDEVLKVIAKRLLDNTRSTDICARIGGDEFVVIATQLENTEHANQIAEKILQQCCSPVEINQHHYQLGASIGVSIYPAHGIDLNQLLQQADQAMYDVKKNGKSGFQVFHSSSTHPL